MTLWDRLRGGGAAAPGAAGDDARVALAAVVRALTEATARGADPLDRELLRARVGDLARTLGLAPMARERFETVAAELDEAADARLALLLRAAESADLQPALRARAAGASAGLYEAAFFGLAKSKPLLTLELLRDSPMRVEELARAWLAAFGVAIEGESAEESSARLARLDYARLLDEAERAKRAAAERMAELEKRRQEAERRSGRSKW